MKLRQIPCALTVFLCACAPSPEDACRHASTVMQRSVEANGFEGASPDKLEQTIAECAQTLEARRQELGEQTFKRHTRCLAQAANVEDLASCDQLIPAKLKKPPRERAQEN